MASAWCARCCECLRVARHHETLLGAGTYGCVVRESRGGVDVAVKHASTPAARARAVLRFEASVLRTLDHPNIVRLVACETHATLREVCIVLELGGPPLTHAVGDAAWSRRRARWAFAQLTRAVEYLHAQHVVHRDLKPDNVLLDADGVVKLIDFGLAHVFACAEHRLLHTRVGSPAYMAPELMVRHSRVHDAYLTDVWSLGVVLVAMLAGERPFRRADASDEDFAHAAAAQSMRKRPSASFAGLALTLLEGIAVDGMLAIDVRTRQAAAWVALTVYVSGARGWE